MNNQPDEKAGLAIYEAAQRRKAGLAIYEAAQRRKDRQKPQQDNSHIYGQPPASTTAPQPAHDAVETNRRKIPPLISAIADFIADFIARLIAVLIVGGNHSDLVCPSTQSTVKLERSGSEGAYKGHWSGPPQVGLDNYHLAVD